MRYTPHPPRESYESYILLGVIVMVITAYFCYKYYVLKKEVKERRLLSFWVAAYFLAEEKGDEGSSFVMFLLLQDGFSPFLATSVMTYIEVVRQKLTPVIETHRLAADVEAKVFPADTKKDTI